MPGLWDDATAPFDPQQQRPRGLFGDAINWLFPQQGPAGPGDQLVRQDQTGAFNPYTPPPTPSVGDLAYSMSGAKDLHEAYQAAQRGEYLQAIGQGAWGAGQAASLAVPAVGAAERLGVPAARSLIEGMPALMADEAGALRLRRGPPLPELETPSPPIGHNMPPEPIGGPPGLIRQVAPDIPSSREPTYGEQLRQQHLDRDNPLPLAGARLPVTPPPHVTDDASMNAAVDRYVQLALGGRVAKDWYTQSGQSILSHTGSPELATPFAGALARTSPQTDVASNLTHAVTMHNQYMAGDPISAGRFPNAMGADVDQIYRQGAAVTGEKIGPFMGAVAEQWDPGMFPHNYVNDIWNMRTLGYPGEGGAPYSGSPTLGQHNYARIVVDRARQRLEDITGEPWSPQQTQAASWTGMKSEAEGTTPQAAGLNFADAMRRNYAQASWESAPGLSTGLFPEYHGAPWADKQAYHDRMMGALTDENGRDIIHAHMGMLSGSTFQGPGYFEGTVSPGSQSPVAVGSAPGGALQGLDPSSKELLNASERVRGLLLNQNAVAWNKPLWAKNVPMSQRSNYDVDIGRPLTPDEMVSVGNAMHQESGTDFHSPIATSTGFRFINPEASGLSNKDFNAALDKVTNRPDVLPGLTKPADIHTAGSDNFYDDNDWQKDALGESYKQGLGAARSPDVQRRSAELLATLGPRVDEVNQWAQGKFGWTGHQPGFWNHQAYDPYKLDSLPNPPKPGEVPATSTVQPGWQKLFGPGGILPGLGPIAGLLGLGYGSNAGPGS